MNTSTSMGATSGTMQRSAVTLAEYYHQHGLDTDEHYAALAAEYTAADRELEADG
ncbi:hypothetical protein [Nocardia sp. NPDC127526]|uniref:hypothetical protein n=1 Tax=Nocardia sp. NPDC127526 TaxID=3345393 RepID=UPI003627705A